jgi:hypothetical protein
MSYLNTPRICFSGGFAARGPTRNNLLAALDDPTILGQDPPWDFDPLANSDFTLTDCRISSAVDGGGHLVIDPCVDPLIGAAVLGTGKMVDLDPEHRRITELVGMVLTVALPDDGTGGPPASVSGKLELTQLRDYWLNPPTGIVTVWQSAIRDPWWSDGIDRSAVLKQLRDASPDGLSVRLTLIATPTNSVILTKLAGALGPWSGAEPQQFVAARRLITLRPPGQLPFPAAASLVDAGRAKLVVDLSDLPMYAAKPGGDLLISGLVAYILRADLDGTGAPIGLGTPRSLTAAQWLQDAGIIEWDLTADQLLLLRDCRVRLTLNVEGDSLIMEEHASGLYVDVDRRSLRLNPGGSAWVDVYARRLGQPEVGRVVTFALLQQQAIAPVATILKPGDFGYPPQPDLPINGEPTEVLLDGTGPIQVVTDRTGHARLTIRARPGEFDLPAARRTIDSQLYFLGEPGGWQSWGAIGPNNGGLASSRVGAGCALTVLVFNTHARIESPTWDDVGPWLRRYAILYPAMLAEAYINLGDKDQVDRNAYEIYRRLKCLEFDDVQYMPVSRDLSEFRRETILAYLRSVMPGQPPCC